MGGGTQPNREAARRNLSLPVRIEEEAVAEVEGAALWYEARRSGLGREFYGAVEEAVSFASDFPLAGARIEEGPSSDLIIRRFPVRKFPFHVVVLERSDHLRVLAVAHDRRRPGYWRTRPSG